MSESLRISQQKTKIVEQRKKERDVSRREEMRDILKRLKEKEEYNGLCEKAPSILKSDIEKTKEEIDDPELEFLLTEFDKHFGNKELPFKLIKKHPSFLDSDDKKPQDRSIGEIQILSLDLIVLFRTMNLQTSAEVRILGAPEDTGWYRRFETVEEFKDQLAIAIALQEMNTPLQAVSLALGLYVP